MNGWVTAPWVRASGTEGGQSTYVSVCLGVCVGVGVWGYLPNGAGKVGHGRPGLVNSQADRQRFVSNHGEGGGRDVVLPGCVSAAFPRAVVLGEQSLTIHS
mmetsp:Transcript_4545/g.10572  ORF Transcript_4545/g.10572 Transcript_4545/m.10572 type:complete len:101 (-) Transcript_4545:1669-1971(-)